MTAGAYSSTLASPNYDPDVPATLAPYAARTDAHQMRAHIGGGLVFRVGVLLRAGRGDRGGFALDVKARLHGEKLLIEPVIAGGDLGRVEVVEIQRLREHKEVFITPGARKRLDDVLFGASTPRSA